MAYSTSRLTVQRLRPRLKRLEQGHECRWVVKKGRANSFAYKVREALYIASQHYPKEFPALARAARLFEISTSQGYIVYARRKQDGEVTDSELQIRAQLDEPPMSEPDVPVQPEEYEELAAHAEETAAEQGDVVVHDGHQTQFSIINRWLEAPLSVRMNFPQAVLDESALAMLFKWTEKQTPKLMIVCSPGDPGIVIAPYDEEMEDFRWKPE